MKDINGTTIKKGDTVDVPEPNETDTHNNEFRGTVHSLDGEFVVVVDMEENYFSVEPERLTVIDEEAERRENDEAIANFLNR